MPLAAPLADPPPSSRLHRPPRRPPYNLRSVAFSVGTLMWLVTIAHGPHPGTDSSCTSTSENTRFESAFRPVCQVGELDRGHRHMPPKIISARGCQHVTRENPKIFRRVCTRAGTLQIYAPGDPPPDFPTHIKYPPTALFFSTARLLLCCCRRERGARFTARAKREKPTNRR